MESVPGLQPAHELAFAGIHVISPDLLKMLSRDGAFSIIDSYLDLAGRGNKILGFRADGYDWRDLGTVDSLKEATADAEFWK